MKKLLNVSLTRDACYEIKGIVYSAYQRNEIVERREYTNGYIEWAEYEVIEKWTKH